MKLITLLTLVATVASQSGYGSYGPGGSGFGTGGAIIFPNHVPNVARPAFPGRPVSPGVVQPISIGLGTPVSPGGHRPVATGVVRPQNIGGCNAQTLVHARTSSSEYHFSWCRLSGQKFDYASANQYCAGLGPGWQGISIEDSIENQFVVQTISGHQIEYIWTSGQRSGPYDWVWGSGNPFVGLDWSHTGLDNVPQPDNRENNAENCLALLNNFYQDGIKWHDIACHHTKPIICERYAAAVPVYG